MRNTTINHVVRIASVKRCVANGRVIVRVMRGIGIQRLCQFLRDASGVIGESMSRLQHALFMAGAMGQLVPASEHEPARATRTASTRPMPSRYPVAWHRPSRDCFCSDR